MDNCIAKLKEIIHIYFFGNSLWDWFLAAIISVLVYFVLHFLCKFIVAKLSGVVADAIKNSKIWLFTAIAFFFGTRILNFGEYDFLPLKILILATFVQAGIWANVIFHWSLTNWSYKNENPSQRAAFVIIHGIGKFIIWVTILLLVLDNFGVQVISLLTGLGVGGIAIALAIQKILGDLFASVSIMIDKPFEIGDLITIDSVIGTVEAIGVKTTRIRSMTGEQIIISNSDLLSSRISNFKRMKERRATLGISVSNKTPNEDLQVVVDIVKSIIENQNDARFDRGHLKSFSASSIDYEFVFWVTKPDYLSFMNVQQQINLAIINALAEKNINLAYSVQKVLLEK
jgi:small-conductance mechanosensitive channel